MIKDFMSKRIGKGLSFGSLAVLLAVLILYGGGFGAEIRGLRISAKDAPTGQQKEVKIYNRALAVIIGIDQYQNLKFDEQLSYAVRDAKGVEEVIRKNFKFDKIITLYNREATKDSIMKILLGDLTREVGEEDALFVFWAGHGYTEKTSFGDLGYLVPFDGSLNSSELYKNISMSTLKDDISKKISAKHVFYVMDACYSGLLATTRGTPRQSGRDFNYLQEITKEKVRQVLTAGDKGQEVLDGGPKGHSVFTGRFLEILENTDDWITANEISVRLREKVFSDARARNHTQTPRYGELFGVGDFVFIPSLEQKVEDTQAKVAGLQKELEQLKATEAAAAKAQDERARRQVEIEKRSVEAKLKAEQLRQQAMDEERRKREQEDREQKEQQTQLARKKIAEEQRMGSLKQEVEEKRKFLGGVTTASLSPESTLAEMLSIEAKIEEINKAFHEELTDSINRSIQGLNAKFDSFKNLKKDEFETWEEFSNRIAREKEKSERLQTEELTAIEKKIKEEYKAQIAPFIEQLKRLSENEFTITAQNLALDIGVYDAASNTYPVSIETKDRIRHIMVAADASIPISREEAREFKLHYQNNMLRSEIKGYFQNTQLFRVVQAYLIDDANGKKYDLFSAKFVDSRRYDAYGKEYDVFSPEFVDLGNGVLYDCVTKMLWLKNANHFGKRMTNSEAVSAVENLNVAGLSGWRLPSLRELERMFTVSWAYIFDGFSDNNYKVHSSASPFNKSGIDMIRYVDFRNRRVDYSGASAKMLVWPVRGGRR